VPSGISIYEQLVKRIAIHNKNTDTASHIIHSSLWLSLQIYHKFGIFLIL
jgi:hypothetical protein